MEKKKVGRVRAILDAKNNIYVKGVHPDEPISEADAKELLHTLDYALRKKRKVVPDWEERLRHRMV